MRPLSDIFQSDPVTPGDGTDVSEDQAAARIAPGDDTAVADPGFTPLETDDRTADPSDGLME